MTPFPSVPSAKRKAEIKALWPSGYGFPSTLDRPSFWGLIAALEAQSRADGDRRVEAMKERACKTIASLIIGNSSAWDLVMIEACKEVGELPTEEGIP